MTLFSQLANLCYPAVCLGCGTAVRAGIPFCPLCAAGLEVADPREVAERIWANDRPLGGIAVYCHWMYDKDGTLQRTHHALKYGNKPFFGQFLGRALGAGLASQRDSQLDAIVPVPLHRSRLYARGYNQCVPIAGGVEETLCLPVVPDILHRRKATRSQTSLSAQARKRNLHNAFVASKSARGCRLLLIDDVLTTGATCLEASKTLLSAGAEFVCVATVGFARL